MRPIGRFVHKWRLQDNSVRQFVTNNKHFNLISKTFVKAQLYVYAFTRREMHAVNTQVYCMHYCV